MSFTMSVDQHKEMIKKHGLAIVMALTVVIFICLIGVASSASPAAALAFAFIFTIIDLGVLGFLQYSKTKLL